MRFECGLIATGVVLGYPSVKVVAFLFVRITLSGHFDMAVFK